MHARHPEFRVSLGAFCTPSTRNSVSLWAFAHPPFCVPRGLCTLSPSEFHVSRDFCTPFAQKSVSLSTLHSKVQAPDTRWAPDSIQEGIRGAYLIAWPLCSLLTLSYHPETPAQLSSVTRSLAINPTQDTSRVVRTLSFPALPNAQLAHSKPTARAFNFKCSVLQPKKPETWSDFLSEAKA